MLQNRLTTGESAPKKDFIRINRERSPFATQKTPRKLPAVQTPNGKPTVGSHDGNQSNRGASEEIHRRRDAIAVEQNTYADNERYQPVKTRPRRSGSSNQLDENHSADESYGDGRRVDKEQLPMSPREKSRQLPFRNKSKNKPDDEQLSNDEHQPEERGLHVTKRHRGAAASAERNAESGNERHRSFKTRSSQSIDKDHENDHNSRERDGGRRRRGENGHGENGHGDDASDHEANVGNSPRRATPAAGKRNQMNKTIRRSLDEINGTDRRGTDNEYDEDEERYSRKRNGGGRKGKKFEREVDERRNGADNETDEEQGEVGSGRRRQQSQKQRTNGKQGARNRRASRDEYDDERIIAEDASNQLTYRHAG